MSTKASPRLETFEDGSSFNALNFCIKFAASDFFVYSMCFFSCLSKAKTAIWSLASASSMTCSSFLEAWSHRSARFMLALVSISTAVLRPGTSAKSSFTLLLKNGRMKAAAINATAAIRSANSNKLSNRLRRVSVGGVGRRNISELKGTSPLGVLRIR